MLSEGFLRNGIKKHGEDVVKEVVKLFVEIGIPEAYKHFKDAGKEKHLHCMLYFFPIRGLTPEEFNKQG
jgi:hypothetical protein